MKTFNGVKILCALLTLISGFATAQNGPICNDYNNYTMNDFPKSNDAAISDISADGDIICFSAITGTWGNYQNSPGVVVSKDGGKTFSNKTTVNGLGSNVVRSLFVNKNRIYVGHVGGISVSLDGGDHFNYYTVGSGQGNVLKIYADDNTVHVLKDGIFLISTNGGRTFDRHPLLSTGITAFYAINNGNFLNFYLVNSSGLLYTSRNGGKTFDQPVPVPDGVLPITNLFVDQSEVIYAGNREGELYVFQKGSSTFSKPFGSGRCRVSGVASKVYVTVDLSNYWDGQRRRLCVTENYGQTFRELYLPEENGFPAYEHCVFAKDNKVYVGGSSNDNKRLFISNNYGATFDFIRRQSSEDNSFKHVFVTHYNPYDFNYPSIYAASGLGSLKISRDGGKTFWGVGIHDLHPNDHILTTFVASEKVYVGTIAGLAISTDGGWSYRIGGNGLPSQTIRGLFVAGNNVYAATQGGLGISVDGGINFSSYTAANTNGGLRSNIVRSVFAAGTSVYAGTQLGLSISHNNGGNFTAKTTANGLGGDRVNSVVVVGNTVYAGTDGGLSISYDKGNTFVNRTVANGLGSNMVNSVYVIGKTVYAATSAGLGISVNGGASFTNMTTANGLGSNDVQAVMALGYSVYAATANGLSFCKATSLPTESSDDIAARMTFETLETDPKAYSVYPNPVTSSQFNVVVDDPEKAEVSLSATNGQSIPIRKIGNGGKERELQLEATSKLNPGIYLLRVKEGDKARTHQLLVPAVAN